MVFCARSLIGDCMQGGTVIEDVGLPAEMAGQRGLKMLTVLSYVFSAHFQHDSILRQMIALLSFDGDYVAPYVLKAFTYLGRFKPLIDSHNHILAELSPVCKAMAMSGTPKQAKHAIRCMFVNMDSGGGVGGNGTAAGGSAAAQSDPLAYEIDIFGDLVDSFKTNLTPQHSHYRTAIVALGHIAYNLPEKYQVQIKNIISRKIVKELLVRDASTVRGGSGAAGGGGGAAGTATGVTAAIKLDRWCKEEELPDETRCKVEGLKTMARWLLGLKQDVLSAQKTFRMLNAFIKQKGDLLEQGNLSAAEMSWLRLSAGTAMLKICEQKGVGDQFTAEQFYNLSQLMVRCAFIFLLFQFSTNYFY